MSQLLSRLLLAMTVVLAAPLAAIVTAILLVSVTRGNEEFVLSCAVLVGMVFLVACWILVWKAQVCWTSQRRIMTVLSVSWSILAASGIGVMIAAATREEFVGIAIGGMCCGVIWLASTALVWRENADERVERLRAISSGAIHCPHCGYNLTGLQIARCPECGTQFTLDELYSSIQDEQRGADLE